MQLWADTRRLLCSLLLPYPFCVFFTPEGAEPYCRDVLAVYGGALFDCGACSAACSYRTSEGIQVPFKVIPVVKELGRTRLEANVSVRSLFGAKMFALNTVVLVPVPDYTAKCNIVVTSGKAKYDATKKAIVSGDRREGWLGMQLCRGSTCVRDMLFKDVPAEPTDGLHCAGALKC
jgi:hypothetical protein